MALKKILILLVFGTNISFAENCSIKKTELLGALLKKKTQLHLEQRLRKKIVFKMIRENKITANLDHPWVQEVKSEQIWSYQRESISDPWQVVEDPHFFKGVQSFKFRVELWSTSQSFNEKVLKFHEDILDDYKKDIRQEKESLKLIISDICLKSN